MKNLGTSMAMTAISLMIAGALSAAPGADALVSGAMTAAGGQEAFAKLGVLEVEIEEQENLLDGTIKSKKSRAFIDAANLGNLRLELPGDLIIVRNQDEGWAKIQGEIDERPQSLRMAKGTVNQKLAPLLMPFSLIGERIELGEVQEAKFKGTPSWQMKVTYPADFYTSPSMSAPWYVHFAREGQRQLSAEVFPPAEFAKARPEGMRFTVLRSTKLNGVDLPAEVLVDGVDSQGVETGHTRIVRLEWSMRGPFEPALFLHPDKLEALEEGYALGLPID